MSTSKPLEEQSAPAAGILRRLWDHFSTVILAVVIALSIRAFVIEPYRIPSGSMLPTLLIGDHLFVNKFVYGARIPFTNLRLPGLREPKRGDVVVFIVARNGERIIPADRRPELPRDDFVKRIVGLPGDRIEARAGRVFVNGERVDLVETGEFFSDERGGQLEVKLEKLAGCRHAVLHDLRPGRRPLDRAEFTVPEGRYFMMGDNRDHSNDSRRWGTVRFEELKGPAFILYWSWSVNGSFLQFLNPINWWTAEKRWDRIFQRVGCSDAPDIPKGGPAQS